MHFRRYSIKLYRVGDDTYGGGLDILGRSLRCSALSAMLSYYFPRTLINRVIEEAVSTGQPLKDGLYSIRLFGMRHGWAQLAIGIRFNVIDGNGHATETRRIKPRRT